MLLPKSLPQDALRLKSHATICPTRIGARENGAALRGKCFRCAKGDHMIPSCTYPEMVKCNTLAVCKDTSHLPALVVKTPRPFLHLRLRLPALLLNSRSHMMGDQISLQMEDLHGNCLHLLLLQFQLQTVPRLFICPRIGLRRRCRYD